MPNPAAKNQFARTAGANSAAAPSVMKHKPITGTMLTENIPPVTTPVPYKSNHMPGIKSINFARYKTAVSNAPANSGGDRLKATLRPGPESSGICAARAFRSMDHPAIKSEISASAIQTASQALTVAC